MRQRIVIGLFIIGTVLACAGEEGEQQQDGPEPGETVLEPAPTRLKVTDQEPYGAYLVDANGSSLYLFMGDSAKNVSNCYSECAEAWPPLLSKEGLETGEGLEEAMVSTITRREGSSQVTYNGWPLYYYAKDQAPGQTKGQDTSSFGAEWYLISPEGTPVEETKQAP